MRNKALIAVAVGFAAGALIGFAYGRGVRSNAPGSVETDYQDGKAIVRFDVNRFLAGGLNDYLN